MKLRMKLTVLLGALVLMVVPAMALASGPPSDPGSQGKGKGPQEKPETPENEKPDETPGPKAPLPEKAKAYGVDCKDQSRKHVKGEKGTPFSQCVTAMARAANNEKLTPSQACKEMSRKHVKGEKGTPFSRCVVAAAQVQKEQQQQQEEEQQS
ncbi:MAG: hypothetical protein ACTHK3_08430 [Solirubrobacterales bacterium]